MSESYTKSRLVAELADNSKLSRRRIDAVLNYLAEIAYREAAGGFTLPGICRLDVVHRKARRARNPLTGQALLIGEHDILRVRPLKRAKHRVAPTPPNLVTVAADSAPFEPASEPLVAEADAAAPGSVVFPAAAPAARVEPGMFSFKCPFCASVIEVTEDCAGESADCPACKRAFKVPMPGQRAQRTSAAAEEEFVSFLCNACSQEIEAPIDMAGSQAECPACGSVMVIPYVSEPGTTQALRAGHVDSKMTEAAKSRTIRIELPDDI